MTLSLVALVVSLVALVLAAMALRRAPSTRLESEVARAHDYAEVMAADTLAKGRKMSPEEKLRHAVAAVQEALPKSNPRAVRVALEAHIHRVRNGAR